MKSVRAYLSLSRCDSTSTGTTVSAQLNSFIHSINHSFIHSFIHTLKSSALRKSEQTTAQIEIQLETNSTETPSLTLSWIPPEEGDDDDLRLTDDDNDFGDIPGASRVPSAISRGMLGHDLKIRHSDLSKKSCKSKRFY